MDIAFIGIGHAGFALASGLQQAGHTVTIAARDLNSESVRAAQKKNPSLAARPVIKAVAAAEVVFLAVPYNVSALALASAGDLSGKVLVDCTNPIGPGLTHLLDSSTSGGETVQALAPDAHVVKAFSIYGYENFEDSRYPDCGDIRPAMLIAGDDPAAKRIVGQLCSELGWEPVDTGGISASLHLEHMTLLWIKMARFQRLGADFVWAQLRR